MIESGLLRWVLTIVFTVTTVWFVFRAARRGAGVPERVSSTGHVVMGALMVPMAWPWGMWIPALPQIVVLSAAALWFLLLGLGNLRSGAGNEHGGRASGLHHAVMMGAMLWMVATMPELMAATPHDSGSGGHHHALGSVGSGVLAASAPPAALPAWITIVTVVLGGYLILSSMTWIASAVDRGRGAVNAAAPAESGSAQVLGLSCACHGAMSVGMGVMLLAALPF